jgi:hypothetical protein
MRLTRLDPETARRLVDGRVAPDDAPPGYSGVAELLAAARGAASESDQVRNVREEDTVSAMQAIVLERLDTPTITPRRRHMRKKVLAAKTAAATTVVLLGAGAAAAATGALPASSVLSKIGISAPGNHGHANTAGQSTAAANNGTKGAANDTVNSNRQGKGPNPNAYPGLCHAQIASGGNANQNSILKSDKINCQGVTPPGGGADTNSGTDQPSGQPSSTPVGPPSSTPPVITPNHGDAGSSASTNSSTGLNTAAGTEGGASSTTGSGAASAGGGNASSHP